MAQITKQASLPITHNNAGNIIVTINWQGFILKRLLAKQHRLLSNNQNNLL